jgi:hypothetical protein
MAAALASGGQVSFAHALATVFDLASRGVLSIEERKEGRRSGRFVVSARTPAHDLMSHERVLVEHVRSAPSEGRTVELAKLVSSLGRRWRDFRTAVRSELASERLLDEDRQHVRWRVLALTTTLGIMSGMAFLLAAIVARRFGGWAILPALALAGAALAGGIVAATMTTLSDAGVRRAQRWKAFGRTLRDRARGKIASGRAESLEHDLPYAVALGAGPAWAKHLKQQAGAVPVPAWFRAVSSGQHADAAFVAMLSSSTSSAHGAGGGAAAGGAAGGGASGAG